MEQRGAGVLQLKKRENIRKVKQKTAKKHSKIMQNPSKKQKKTALKEAFCVKNLP